MATIETGDDNTFVQEKYKLIDSSMHLNDYTSVQNQRGGIKDFIIAVYRGQARIKKCERINSEVIEVKEGGSIRQYFTHVKPILLTLDKDVMGRGGRAKQLRLHFVLEDEPMTRDLYTGEIADQNKKYEKLKEIGVLIDHSDRDEMKAAFAIVSEEDLTEAEEAFDWEALLNVSPTGYYVHPEWAGTDPFGVPRVIYDVSDIDAIREEVARLLESDLIQAYIAAAMKEVNAKHNKEMMWIVLIFVIAIIFQDLILTGVLESLLK